MSARAVKRSNHRAERRKDQSDGGSESSSISTRKLQKAQARSAKLEKENSVLRREKREVMKLEKDREDCKDRDRDNQKGREDRDDGKEREMYRGEGNRRRVDDREEFEEGYSDGDGMATEV
jgi:hypothetical protein